MQKVFAKSRNKKNLEVQKMAGRGDSPNFLDVSQLLEQGISPRHVCHSRDTAIFSEMKGWHQKLTF